MDQAQLPSLGLGGISEEVCLTQEAAEEPESVCERLSESDYPWIMPIMQQLTTMTDEVRATSVYFRSYVRQMTEDVTAYRRQQCQAKRPHVDTETLSLPNSEALSRRKKSKLILQGYER
jgi:hypothetical protein